MNLKTKECRRMYLVDKGIMRRKEKLYEEFSKCITVKETRSECHCGKGLGRGGGGELKAADVIVFRGSGINVKETRSEYHCGKGWG